MTDFLRAWGVVLSMMRLYVPSVLPGLVVSSATVRFTYLLGEQTSVIATKATMTLQKSLLQNSQAASIDSEICAVPPLSALDTRDVEEM